MKKQGIIIFLIWTLWPGHTFSQNGISHEIGIIGGAVQFGSDFGERNNEENNIKNTGFFVSFVDYLNFSYSDFVNNYVKEHFKIRNDLSYSQTELQHYGRYATGNSLFSRQYAAMRGLSRVISLGSQIEYNLIHIHEFERHQYSFEPYIGLGPQITYYFSEISSLFGPIGPVDTTPLKYRLASGSRPHGYSSENKFAFALAVNTGTRFKLTLMSDLVFDLRAQYFFSDWVDGLNPNKHLYKENKHNDWQTYVGLGYIIYFED